jgi:hypothetical protein
LKTEREKEEREEIALGAQEHQEALKNQIRNIKIR